MISCYTSRRHLRCRAAPSEQVFVNLSQARLLPQQRLVAHLEQHVYIQHEHVDCLFHYPQRGTSFSLVVDDFGEKYRTEADAKHLIETLEKLCMISK